MRAIVSDPKVTLGKPVIRGTRITVELILEQFAVGRTEEEILRAHPHITREGIRAAIAFAAGVVHDQFAATLEQVAT